jgi:hypothetical protein
LLLGAGAGWVAAGAEGAWVVCGAVVAGVVLRVVPFSRLLGGAGNGSVPYAGAIRDMKFENMGPAIM